MSEFEPPATDPDQPGEAYDDDLLDGDEEYPPDHPLGVEETGVTALEERAGETVEERDRRTEPEVWARRPRVEPRSPVLEDDREPGAADEEKDLVAPPLPSGDVGPLADDDEFTGDETTRDVATERVPEAAEEAAVHTRRRPPGATE